MVSLIVFLLAGLGLTVGTQVEGTFASPKDFTWGRVMCTTINDIRRNNVDACQKTLEERTNKFCEGTQSFFDESDMASYVMSLAPNMDYINDMFWGYMRSAEEEYEMLDAFCQIPDACDGDTYRQMARQYDFVYSLRKAARNMHTDNYQITNTINLGAMCLASNPRDYFHNDVARSTYDLSERLEKLCNDTLKKQKNEFVKALKYYDWTYYGNEYIKHIQDTYNTSAKDYCRRFPSESAYFMPGADLVEYLDDIFMKGLWGIDLDFLVTYFDCMFLYDNEGYCQRMVAPEDGDKKDGETQNNSPLIRGKFEVTLFDLTPSALGYDNDEYGTIEYASKSENTFDLLEASKNNPEYTKLVEDLDNWDDGYEVEECECCC